MARRAISVTTTVGLLTIFAAASLPASEAQTVPLSVIDGGGSGFGMTDMCPLFPQARALIQFHLVGDNRSGQDLWRGTFEYRTTNAHECPGAGVAVCNGQGPVTKAIEMDQCTPDGFLVIEFIQGCPGATPQQSTAHATLGFQFLDGEFVGSGSMEMTGGAAEDAPPSTNC